MSRGTDGYRAAQQHVAKELTLIATSKRPIRHLRWHGWSVGSARKAIGVFGGLGMMFLMLTIFTESFLMLVACFAFSTFAYAAFSTVILNLPADIYPTGSVASVSGLGGTGAGIGTIAAIYITGRVSDRYSFAAILVGASFLPLVAVAAMLLLVRNTKDTRQGLLNPI